MSGPAGRSLGDVGAGHVLGRYELLLPIAAGGMAQVWAARLKGTRGFQKTVAIKTMLPSLSADPQFEQMFLDEASLASGVRHPHVAEILDLGEQDGVLYLVMEWVDGEPLNVLVKAAARKGGVPLPVAVRIMTQALSGLHAAHELRDEAGSLVGLVHRDISPQNVLITWDGVVKVVDFGVAKAMARASAQSEAGQVKGKAAYMSPEQARGEIVDRRTDVFAMGILLYILTTGKHPFRADSDQVTMLNICSPDPVRPPSQLMPGFPPGLELVVKQALAKDPTKRFPTANDMLRALDRALPPSMRVSTDEEVSGFVRSMVGDRMEARREQIKEALRTADEVAAGRTSMPDLSPLPEISGLLPAVGEATSRTEPVRTSVGVSLPVSAGGGTHTAVLAAVGGGAAVALVAGVLLALRGAPAPAPASAPPAPAVSVAPPPTVAATALAPSAVEPAAPPLESAVVEELPPPEAAPEADAGRAAPRGGPRAAAAATSAAAPAKAPTRFIPKIRDPGF